MTPAGWEFLEPVRLVAPLGVRFWDPTTGAVVGAGLTVEVFAQKDPDRRFSAVANRSGVFSARGLPGLRDYENGGPLPDPFGPFVIEVRDGTGRFLPFNLTATEPGLLKWNPPNEPMVPLFSAPARAVPAGMAVVRAQLVCGDPKGPAKPVPAAWAVLEVTPKGVKDDGSDGPPVLGLADGRGQVAVVFPYPEVPDPPVHPVEPPAPALPVTLADRKWTVAVRARFAPGAARTQPDLRAALKQPLAKVFDTTASATDEVSKTLWFNQELVLKTSDPADAPEPISELFLTT